jgi:hypothetical protein
VLVRRLALVLALVVAAAACSRSDEPPPVATLTPAAATPGVEATPDASAATPVPAAPPAAAPEPAAGEAADYEFDFLDEADDPDSFEIDADATQFFGYVPMTVHFAAKALNGTPPFTFVWDFGDGSPQVTGERVSHTFTQTGWVRAAVLGRDATGAESAVQLAIFTLTPEEYARRKGIDLASLPTPATPVPTPPARPPSAELGSPAVTPPVPSPPAP